MACDDPLGRWPGGHRERCPDGSQGRSARHMLVPVVPARIHKNQQMIIESEAGLGMDLSRSQTDGQQMTQTDPKPTECQVKSTHIIQRLKTISGPKRPSEIRASLHRFELFFIGFEWNWTDYLVIGLRSGQIKYLLHAQ